MPKAARVLAALKRDGWQEVHKGDVSRTWAFHDRHDLGQVQLAQIARQFGYTLDDLRKL